MVLLPSSVARGKQGAVAPPGPIYRVFPTMSNYNEGCMVTILICQLTILKAKFLYVGIHISNERGIQVWRNLQSAVY